MLSRPLHSKKVTEWLAKRQGGGTIGPFFFEDEDGVAATINSTRYVNTALKPFWRELQGGPRTATKSGFNKTGRHHTLLGSPWTGYKVTSPIGTSA